MINHFRDAMHRPIIDIAHSMGCAQLYVRTWVCEGQLTIISAEFIYHTSPSSVHNNTHLAGDNRREPWQAKSGASSYYST